jgi:hypothetical protein
MSTLDRLQEEFQRYLLAPDTARTLLARVVGDARATAEVRLGIYADAYRLRLLEALETDYPGLRALLGDTDFERLGRAYIDAHPSRHFSLRWFGQHLEAFLRNAPPYRDQPVLADMARFESAMTDAFDAADARVLGIDDMAGVPPEAWAGMRLALHPSVRRIDLGWTVPPFWKAVDAEQEPDGPPQPTPQPIGWVVWRQALDTYFRSLEVDEAWALDTARRGETFAALCEGICEWVDPHNAPARAAGFLKQWIADGMVSAAVTSSE